ncbi:L-2-hydroxyglutarate dehydrogenase, mitochondrial-like [Hydractinia symbiolongicarpus]|uniref:L-2-hydroxyglutarate dehydrogenase, mitochondrial-like n=1 Tax=Hydractinia symbiolongicarpus TaxID=13093 RepID=UPI00254B9A82|nr:L-2-hydroxyglutarate dehydrogenase, mitochondrial-like [Hydractinia symbiolongicarpus]
MHTQEACVLIRIRRFVQVWKYFRMSITYRFVFQLTSMKTLGRCGSFAAIKRCYHNGNYDVAIVGGGIVGLATAQELVERQPALKCILLEKENVLAKHQTGHNSGVIHAGMYYTPGSLRAKLCVEGLDLTYKYCDEYKIPYKKVGKLVVATSKDEIPYLQHLYDRGQQNNVSGLSLITEHEIKQIEPYCQGVAALHSPNTGIVDFAEIARKCGDVFTSRGGTIVNGYEVTDLKYSSLAEQDEKGHAYPVNIHGLDKPPLSCRYVITCSGLYSDKLAALTGCDNEPRIVPIRGDYFTLRPEKNYLVRGNIYPVPNPQFPFLGFHFTPRMDGSVWMGPNAILSFKREGYNRLDFDLKDTINSLTYRGFQRLLLKHWKFAVTELLDTFYVQRIAQRLQKLVPEIELKDLQRGPCGIRAQALDRDGNLVDDFVFDFGEGQLGERCLHVRNAPSPAATSSLAIAKMVVGKFQKEILRGNI